MKKIIINLIDTNDYGHKLSSLLNNYSDSDYDDIVCALQLLQNTKIINDWSIDVMES